MRTLKADIFLYPSHEASWMEKIGWYEVVFFVIKGSYSLITPFIIYAYN